MYSIVKRLFCFMASLSAIVVLSPVFVLAIVGILISDWGPVFYCAHRIGKNDKPFKMYKFRSMRVDGKANESSFKADTKRIFKWGAIMRATKIDELPQLLNCLLGDMAIVGPRPAAEDQVAVMREGKYAVVAHVRPGLTSPAALYDYLYGDTIEDEYEYETMVLPTRRELEAFYVSHVNVTFDIKMIHWTVVCILGSIAGRPQNWILKKLEGYVKPNGVNVL